MLLLATLPLRTMLQLRTEQRKVRVLPIIRALLRVRILQVTQEVRETRADLIARTILDRVADRGIRATDQRAMVQVRVLGHPIQDRVQDQAPMETMALVLQQDQEPRQMGNKVLQRIVGIKLPY